MTRPIPSKQLFVRPLLVAICLACVILSVLSCSTNKDRHARRLLEGLPPEFVRHLVSSDSSSFALYARQMGFEALNGMNNHVFRRVHELSIQGKTNDARLLEGYADRIAQAFSTVYQDDSYLSEIAFLRDLPEKRREELWGSRWAYIAAPSDHLLSPEEALEKHTRYARIFASLGDSAWVAMANLHMSDAYERLGDYERQKQYLIAACSEFRKLGENKMACETLGRLGSQYEKWGQPDSMAICYEQALEIAYRGRMGYQAARILDFFGAYYGRLGRLDVKRRLLERAIDVARAYDPGCYEVRFIKETMKFHANLGCWDIVENLVTQVRGLERECEDLELGMAEIHILRTDVYEAQVRMASGDTARADEILRRVNRRLPELKLPASYRGEDDEYAYCRAQGLLSNGRPRDALEEARKKLSRPPTESLPLWSAQLSIVAAKAACALGESDVAQQALAEFDRFAVGEENELRTELSERDALLGMVALARGDTGRAAEAAANGLTKLRETAASIDASVGSYLWLTDADELRQLVHDVVAGDDIAGYGAEFYWRELYLLFGARERGTTGLGAAHARRGRTPTAASPSSETLVHGFQSLGRQALESLSRPDRVHTVYLVRDKEIWRWTATRSGVRKDVLSSSTEEVRRLVTSTRKAMSSYPDDPDAPADEGLRKNLRALARALLPPEILDTNSSPLESPSLLVTTDNFLGTIPFEAFDVGFREEYEPLLEHRDVAYVRHIRRDPTLKSRGRGLILVNGEPSAGFRGGPRRLRTLGGAEAEGETLAAYDSSAILLSGESATKQRLAQSWENAPYIYIAAHTVCDPPYLAMIVLGKPGDDPSPDAAVLDVTDIRAADLRRCGVVVLSGCSSGAPYVAAGGVAPSLGDAFLDAGAGAVVHTFWDVKDKDALRIGTSFVKGWKNAKMDEIHALAEARRAQLRGPKGIRHPSSWASYAITVSRL